MKPKPDAPASTAGMAAARREPLPAGWIGSIVAMGR